MRSVWCSLGGRRVLPECVGGVGYFLFIRQAGPVERGVAVLVLDVELGPCISQHLHYLVVAVDGIFVRRNSKIREVSCGQCGALSRAQSATRSVLWGRRFPFHSTGRRGGVVSRRARPGGWIWHLH